MRSLLGLSIVAIIPVTAATDERYPDTVEEAEPELDADGNVVVDADGAPVLKSVTKPHPQAGLLTGARVLDGHKERAAIVTAHFADERVNASVFVDGVNDAAIEPFAGPCSIDPKSGLVRLWSALPDPGAENRKADHAYWRHVDAAG